MYDIIVIGAGPAGMTSALYALRAGKSVLIMESAGFGGQIVYSHKIENYPAIKQVSGMEFADVLTQQIIDLGVEVALEKASKIKKAGSTFEVFAGDKKFEGKTVIIAAGVHHRRLGLVNEERLIGSGISFCAVCDGAFFRDRVVAVAGGGNTALQDALFLSAFDQWQ